MQQDMLFKQFARLEPDADGAPGGIGLGLLFVRTVVERHGGHVLIDSQPGHGSRFHFTLQKIVE
jgi:signal transduction histidine kinase